MLKIGERENAVERVATVIDPAGVVMTTGLGSTRGGVKVAIESARVVFPGDEESTTPCSAPSTAGSGSPSSSRTLGGKKIASVNLDDAVEPKVGDELFGVSRLEDGFDYAPFYGTCEVVGQVTKPRAMWMADGVDRRRRSRTPSTPPTDAWRGSSSAAGRLGGPAVGQDVPAADVGGQARDRTGRRALGEGPRGRQGGRAGRRRHRGPRGAAGDGRRRRQAGRRHAARHGP